MACPTEEFIESISGLKLSQIKTLDLGKMGFNSLSTDVFDKMPGLTSLDLSENKLEEIPPDLKLPKLKVLDVSDNLLTSLEFVSQFPLLEELETDGNDLEPSDKYIATSLCPRLETLNDNDTETLRKMVQSFRTRLQPQVNGVWEASFAAKYTNGIKEEELKSVRNEFMWILAKQKLTGPTTMNKFRNYMVEILADELLHKVKDGGFQSPVKRRRIDNNGGTPSTPRFTAIKRKGLVANLPSISDYEPLHFIRCHSGGSKDYFDNDPADGNTQVWQAAFEPDPYKKGEQTGIVATVGGNSICLIDCNSGRVMKRYKEEDRMFFAVAWTTLDIEFGGKSNPSNILCATGVDAIVKLLHPDQLVCYHEFEIGTKRGPAYINSIKFHPSRPTHLYCGDSDGNVTGWDIGIPTGSEYETTVKPLFTLKTPAEAVLNIILGDNDRLVAGCEGGCYVWNLSPKLRGRIKDPNAEIVLTEKTENNVDGMCVINGDLVASKITGTGCIYLWRMNDALDSRKKIIKVDPLAILEWKPTETMYLNIGASKQGLLASGDDDGKLWLYNLSHLLKKSTQADELLRPSRILPWPECDIQVKRTEESQMKDLLEEKEELLLNYTIVSENSEYIVACSDSNVVAIWRRQQ